MRRTDADQRAVESLSDVARVRRDLSRYDFVLGLIPLLLSASAVGGYVSDVPVPVLVGVAALVCMAAIADVLFVHPPSDVAREREGATARQRRRRTG
jgi:hypothetical protein